MSVQTHTEHQAAATRTGLVEYLAAMHQRAAVAELTYGSAAALDAVMDALAGLEVYRERLAVDLRLAGQSWAQIAEVMGVSKQAAAKRYSPAADRGLAKAIRADVLAVYGPNAGPALTHVAAEQF